MRFLIPLLRRLQFRWVASLNGILLFCGQMWQFRIKDAADERSRIIAEILGSFNSSLTMYLVAGIGFFLYYRHKEKSPGGAGRYMNSFWIPLTVWMIGLVMTVAMTAKSIYFAS